MTRFLIGIVFAAASIQFVATALPPGNDDLISIHSLALDLARGQDSLLYPGKDFARNDEWIAHHEANLREIGDTGQPNWCFYPPLVPFAVSFLSTTSAETWRIFWAAMQLIFVALYALLIERLLKVVGARPNRILIFALVLGSYPIARSIELGQTSLLLALFIWGSIYFKQTGQRLAGIVLAGFVIFVKPFLAVIVAVDALRKRWLEIAGYAAIYVALLLISLVLIGAYAHVEYWNLLSTLSHTQTAFYGNQSILGGALRFLSYISPSASLGLQLEPPSVYGFMADPVCAWWGRIIALAVLGIAGWAQLRGGAERPVLSYSLWFSAVALALPISWEHHLVFLVPALAYLWTLKLSKLQRIWLLTSTLLLEFRWFTFYGDSFGGRIAETLPLLGNLTLFLLLVTLHLQYHSQTITTAMSREAHVGA